MTINTKYSIGQEVYFLIKEEDKNYIELHKDTILEITATKEKIIYIMDAYCDEVQENEIVPMDYDMMLAEKVRKLFGGSNE